MIQKQTIYFPSKNDLEDYNISEKTVQRFVFTSEQLNEYTRNVIKQTLQTAAKNALCDFDEGGCTEFVDKQSITDTFEEIYQKFKV